MEYDLDRPARLVAAIGKELLQLSLDLSDLQNELAQTAWGGEVAGMGEPLAAADVGRIVALQDLDRLTQVAAALGSLSARVSSYLHDRPDDNEAGETLSAALQLVPLGALRDRLEKSLHRARPAHTGDTARLRCCSSDKTAREVNFNQTTDT